MILILAFAVWSFTLACVAALTGSAMLLLAATLVGGGAVLVSLIVLIGAGQAPVTRAPRRVAMRSSALFVR